MAEHRRLLRVYRWYAPVYDRLFARIYLSARARSLASLQLAPDARVLLAAVGTGLDLPLLPAETVAVGIDCQLGDARGCAQGQPLRVLSDQPALGGVYRTILLERV